MKKIIIPFVLLVCLLSFVSADWDYFQESRGVYVVIGSQYYFNDRGLGIYAGYLTNYADEYVDWFEDDPSTTADDPTINFYESNYFTYGQDSSDNGFIPYTIHSCYLKCNIDNPSPDHIEYMPLLRDSEGFDYVSDPYTYSDQYWGDYRCFYDESLAGEEIVGEYGCFLTPNYHYGSTSDVQSIDTMISNMGFSDDQIFNMCSGGSVCVEISSQDTLCSSPDTDWGVAYSFCSNVIIDSYQFNFTFNGDGNKLGSGGSLTDPTETYTGGSGSDIGGEPQEENKDKLYTYEDIESQEKKKNIILTDMILIMEIVFSVVLLIFYIFELAIIIYVFTSWIPAIIRSPIEILKRFGGLK